MDVCAKCGGELEDGGCINLDCENWRFGKQWNEMMARDEPKVRHSDRLSVNPKPLKVVKKRNNVTALAAARDMLRARTREDRLRVWLALGGAEEEFNEEYPE